MLASTLLTVSDKIDSGGDGGSDGGISEIENTKLKSILITQKKEKWFQIKLWTSYPVIQYQYSVAAGTLI